MVVNTIENRIVMDTSQAVNALNGLSSKMDKTQSGFSAIG